MSSPSCAPRTGSGGLCHHAKTEHTSTIAANDHHAGAILPSCCRDHAMAEEPEPTCSEPHHDTKYCDDQKSATMVKAKKCVRWSTITVHEFGVGLGGSAVSNKGGPSIGLADPPEFTWTTRVGEMAERAEGLHRFTPSQRIRLLQAAGIPDGIITRHARETNIILGSRRRSKTSWEDSDCDEAEEEEGDEDEEGCKEQSRKRSADQATLEHPCAVYLRRPRMIPVNYV
ncbi:hypothetical protein F441_11614 [Phytophthora nicotianae CJ01A1]|uniref:Cysteine/serine-rich nuclear protein N-terminal domain-containing protein n=5 Tax=Phytophthora nicotianae TaxID=4792 RepID=V9EWT1_PHYNI|nr:hypothetical protein F443_11680 [Phytophthora nicotianae P1569]ETO72005.1 hypothetical protein F444_11760 [Phytophthora nicotianae P1976]ETP13141.1 hypothetical protein F441_11614 [Phytophthora nicotianae CJ01A1]